jgi:hypothetical protein
MVRTDSDPLADLDFSIDGMELASIDGIDDSAERRIYREAAELSDATGLSFTLALEQAMRGSR